ncbi:MAG: hypothetical protein ACLVAK_07735 [Clostridia bacterium]
MTNETIINKWKVGKTAIQVAKDYMQDYNKEVEKKKEPRITKEQALAHVEPIIFEYETKDWRKE